MYASYTSLGFGGVAQGAMKTNLSPKKFVKRSVSILLVRTLVNSPECQGHVRGTTQGGGMTPRPNLANNSYMEVVLEITIRWGFFYVKLVSL